MQMVREIITRFQVATSDLRIEYLSYYGSAILLAKQTLIILVSLLLISYYTYYNLSELIVACRYLKTSKINLFPEISRFN